MKPLVKHRGEILAGLKTAGKRDFSDVHFRPFDQQVGGGIDSAAGEKFHRGNIGNLAAIGGKTAAPEAAVFSHGLQRPRFVQASRQFFQKQPDGALAAGKTFIQPRLAVFQHFSKGNDKFVDENFEAGDGFRIGGSDAGGLAKFAIAAGDFLVGMPDGLLIVPQNGG